MLARVPAGDLIDRMRHEPKLRAAEVLHSDTTWRPCTVLAWARHRGSWAVLIRWPDGHEDWREYDPRNIRPGPTLGTAGWSFTDMRSFRLGGPGPHCNIGQPHCPVIGRPGKRAAAPGRR